MEYIKDCIKTKLKFLMQYKIVIYRQFLYENFENDWLFVSFEIK